ncbi:MAG: ATP-binding protein [Ardenticatenaceae bacterium]|nr:ATP-binding protein [Ardenticatenaceae bacterium]
MTDISFRHMQLEFARLDIMLHRQIQRLQQSDNGYSMLPVSYHLSQEQAYLLLQRPFGHAPHLADDDSNTAYEDALQETEQQIAQLVGQAEQEGETLRLFQLAVLLDLDRLALDMLLLSMAPVLDTRYGRLYGFIQDDLTQKRPSLNLLLDLLCPTSAERLTFLRYCADDAPLRRHRLVELTADPGQTLLIHQALSPDDSIVTWLLLGHYRPNTQLRDHLTYEAELTPDLGLLAEMTRQELAAAALHNPVLIFHDLDDLKQQTAAQWLAARRQRPLLTLNLTSAVQMNVLPQTAVQLALRDALLTGSILHISGWDSCLEEDTPPPELLTAVCQHPNLILISGEKKWQPRDVPRHRRLAWFAFPIPDYAHRHQLLHHFLQEDTSSTHLDLEHLAGQFRLTSGQLRDLVNTARDLAGQDGRSLQNQHLYAAARAHSNPRLAALARKITPRYDWPDLILPQDQVTILHEMVATVRSRPLVLEQWGVGQKLAASAGITALFYGQPGTGKTMAAELVAHELGLDLYKIDLSSMVSKYIGETEKNLEKIFNEAETSNAILFFDEADAIFGKRSEVKDAHDRYANIEVSYLLQRMEAYNGVTILATNLKANLDEAFTRRLQFAVDFPFPKEPDRLRIWQALFPPDVPRAPDLNLALMAERFDIAGGNIRNIIVTAAYLAASNGQVVSMEHMLHATRRELQKMGRLLNERDLELKKL